MTKRSNQATQRRPATALKRSTLAIGLAVAFAFAIIIGITGGAMGLGSLFPRLNAIAQPFVCPGGQIEYTKQVTEVGTASYHTARWFCRDHSSGDAREIEGNRVFIIAGIFHGIVIFAILLLITYLYWNSSIGPAKNDGPLLW